VDTYESGDRRREESKESVHDEAVLRRLRSLGYIE